MSADFDVIVLGAGNAGQAAAGVARAAGLRVLIIEARDVGGTCPLRGCVPKKVLVAAAEALDLIARASEHGIHVGPATLDWPALIARKQTFVAGVPAEMEASLRSRGIEVRRGRARFVDRRVIELDGERLEARKIVVATGSAPRPLGIPGGELAITSDELLEMAKLPRSIVMVGGGVVALEFAHVLARAGAKVTLVHRGARLLGGRDADAVDQITALTRAAGVDIRTETRVERIARDGDRLAVTVEHGGRVEIVADRVVNAIGRVAALDDLDLAAGGIERDARGAVRVDAQLGSVSNPDVFFAGDALAGPPQLSPIATYEGGIVGHNLTGGAPRSPEYASIPSVVFTIPPLASVGLTEAQAREAGLDVEVKVNDMRGWRSGRTYAETGAFAKVLVEKGSGRVVGAHLVGHGAQETIHAFAFAMKHGVTADEMRETVYAYPTFHADLKYLV